MTPHKIAHWVLRKTVLFSSVAVAAMAVAAPHRVAKDPTRSKQQQTDAGLVFCVSSDQTLHAAQAGTCASSQTRVELEAASQQFLDCTECGAQESHHSADASAKAHNAAVADLEQRIDALHVSPLLTVIDQQKRPMMTVQPGALVVYDENGAPVATMRAHADGGSITATSSSGLSAILGALSTEAGLQISEQSVLRLRMTGQAGGTYALAVPALGASGDIAGIGESKASSGAIVAASPSGAVKASMTVADGKGVVGIFNSTGLSVLSLTEGASAGGLLALGNAQSAPTLKMGVKNNRYGVVLTGPRAGFPLVTGSGLPGSYILGCAPGPACEP